jgi:phosphate transport system substrate-binding protein
MVRTSIALALLATLPACGRDGGGGGDAPLPGSKAPAATTAAASGVTVTGAGATFPYPLYTRWIAEFRKRRADVKVDYQSIGSGGGIRQITERTVDFGASDAPMSDEQLAKAAGVVHVPTCLGAVAVTYHLDEAPGGLRLGPDAIAGIFLGTVKAWDDPAIAKDNPGVKLPAKPIASVHRSDGSGTTKIFVDYLAAVSPAWKGGPGSGTSVSWPGGLGAKGNEGVSATVKSTPGSIGYVELAFAKQNGLSFAAIKNKAGQFVAPSVESTTAAAAGAAARIPDDLRVSIVDAEGDGAYPIAGFTYVLVHAQQKDAAKGEALGAFLAWALGEGQAFGSGLDYAPLPASVAAKARAKVAALTGPDGAPLVTAK